MMIPLLLTDMKSWMYKPHLCCDTNLNTQSLCAFSYLCAIHKQRVNDPVPSLPAAHSLHAAVVVSQCEMCFCTIIHKLPLQVQTDKTLIRQLFTKGKITPSLFPWWGETSGALWLGGKKLVCGLHWLTGSKFLQWTTLTIFFKFI